MSIPSKSKERDLLIAGAGVGGLVLALALGRKGFRVTVVDRQPGPLSFPRGEIIQPNGLKVLDQLGLLPELLSRDLYQSKAVRFYGAGGRPLCTVDYRTLPSPYAYSLVLLPAVLQNLLLEKIAQSPRIEILWDASFQSLLRKGGKVAGATIARQGEGSIYHAPVVIGADGVRSRVREALGIPARLHTYADGYLTAVVDRPAGFQSELRYYLGKRMIFGAFPVSKEKLYLFYMIPSRRLEAFKAQGIDAFRRNLLALNPEIASLVEEPLKGLSSWEAVSFMRCFRVRCRQWTVDGGALLGDAAHAMNPHVAQGRNAAMEDGMALAETLASCFQKGDFSREALAGYESARRSKVETLQRLGDEMTWLWNTGWPPLVWARDRIFRTLHHRKELQAKMLKSVAGVEMQPFDLYDRWQALRLWNGFLRTDEPVEEDLEKKRS